jgi:hypothetical protein
MIDVLISFIAGFIFGACMARIILNVMQYIEHRRYED